MRQFEIAKGYEDKEINIPQRSTKGSAGYDIEAAEDILVMPFAVEGKSRLIPTGIKAQMNKGEFLGLYPRSSIGVKHLQLMPNSIGVIDQDYYSNEDNDGHIMVPFINLGKLPFKIKKGDRIAQGIFQIYLTTDNETDVDGKIRQGGLGSTGLN